jgi:hypothetical protein
MGGPNSSERIPSFEKFWPFYLGEHSQPATRWMHFFGDTAALGLVASALINGSWILVPAAVVVGYGFAWVSHFFIEKNKPAAFSYPVWSFIADWKMWALMVTGRLNAELTETQRSRPAG